MYIKRLWTDILLCYIDYILYCFLLPCFVYDLYCFHWEAASILLQWWQVIYRFPSLFQGLSTSNRLTHRWTQRKCCQYSLTNDRKEIFQTLEDSSHSFVISSHYCIWTSALHNYLILHYQWNVNNLYNFCHSWPWRGKPLDRVKIEACLLPCLLFTSRKQHNRKAIILCCSSPLPGQSSWACGRLQISWRRLLSFNNFNLAL